MSTFDIIIAAVLAGSLIMGFFQGIISSVLSLAGLVFGGILATRFYATLSDKLTFISDANVAKIVAFLMIFVAVIIVAAIVAGILKKIVHGLGAGWADRLAGALFGLLAGASFWGALLNWLVASSFMGFRDAILASKLAMLLVNWFHWIFPVLPPGTPL